MAEANTSITMEDIKHDIAIVSSSTDGPIDAPSEETNAEHETSSARPDEDSQQPPAKKPKTEIVNGATSAISSSEEVNTGGAEIVSTNTALGDEVVKVDSTESSALEEDKSVCETGVIVECSSNSTPSISVQSPALAKKKKIALLIAYCGTGYSGMQKNPDVNTIEDELLAALCKAGAIRSDVKDDLFKMSFQRCARTDKGVSAAGQVVSLKMVPEIKLPDINKHLPPSIRVFGLKKVTKGFDSKNQCSARTYQYLLPTFAFAPTVMQTVSSYRIKAPNIELINDTLKLLCGTHNFHNFTSGKAPSDPSSKRYIMVFNAGDPFVVKGHEFITLSVTGQSFMLHQIRKMIGLCIAICRGYCDAEVIEKAWGKNKVDIPKAPGLGLILDKVHYDRYNQRYGSDGMHEPLLWTEQEEELSKFKNSFIWDTIIESEITQKSMQRWLLTLNNHTYTESRNLLDSKQTTND